MKPAKASDTLTLQSNSLLLKYFKTHANASLAVCFVGILSLYSYYAFL